MTDTSTPSRNTARFLAGTPLAAIATGGLFMLMIGLISAEFEPQPVADTASFEINPVVEDVETVRRSVEIEPLATVETPPAPPPIDTQDAELPTVQIASLGGDIPDFDPVTIDPGEVTIVESDTDAQPLVRIPPIMPPRAERSGHCDVRFDVSPAGKPLNVEATSCTDTVFRSATVRSVQKWQYKAKVRDGQAVARTGVRTRVSFQLTDERGNIIPK